MTVQLLFFFYFFCSFNKRNWLGCKCFCEKSLSGGGVRFFSNKKIRALKILESNIVWDPVKEIK